MSPKNSSLAFDETMKEFESSSFKSNFEPDLKVIINAHYVKSLHSRMASEDVIEVNGRITISF